MAVFLQIYVTVSTASDLKVAWDIFHHCLLMLSLSCVPICVCVCVCFAGIWLWMLQRDPVFKSVFMIFYQGNELLQRVRKICEG